VPGAGPAVGMDFVTLDIVWSVRPYPFPCMKRECIASPRVAYLDPPDLTRLATLGALLV
jgi:hypothetical protein